MTIDELKKVCRRMLWVIPGMLLAMVGDYCMGIEPKDSYAITGMISSEGAVQRKGRQRPG